MTSAVERGMRRIALLLLCLLPRVAPLPGATLEYLSLDSVILKSSDIVRAQVMSSSAQFRGSVIYTHWKVQVTERLKGADQPSMDVMVPGGAAAGFHQDVPGAPQLVVGKEYLLFLWTSKSGSTYLTGWGQGMFQLSKNASGDLMATRPAISESMLDPKTWLPVKDQGIQMSYSDMTASIKATLAGGSQ